MYLVSEPSSPAGVIRNTRICAYSSFHRSTRGCVFWRAPERGTRKDCHYAQVCLSPELFEGTSRVNAVPPLSLYSSRNFPVLRGDISPKVATPLSVPLTVEMFACDPKTAHYYHTCWPLYPCQGGHNYPKFSFNLLLMTFYNPLQEYQRSQKTTPHHVIIMGETYSRDMYISQYSSRALVQNYLPPGQRRKLLQ